MSSPYPTVNSVAALQEWAFYLVKSDVAAGATNTSRPLTHPSDLTRIGGLAVDATPIEEWRPVVGWEGLYEVSDQGRVRSLDRQVAFGSRTRFVNGRLLGGGKTIHGVMFVALSNGKNTRRQRSVHQLVLEAFVGPRPEGMEGCHWDDNSENNALSNLRWDTHAANMQDKLRNGGDHNTNKTRCKSGHEYTPENTKVGRDGGRFCRECHRADGRAKYWADIENQRALKREAARRSRAARQERTV